jgi:predicted transcriptional regulator
VSIGDIVLEQVDYSKSAQAFLEFASEQRLSILDTLRENESKLSALAKLLGSTPPEVFRNLERLEKSSLIEKKKNGNYELATYGKALFAVLPSLEFISTNEEYFKEHSFGDMPHKFVQRIGALIGSELIHGFTSVEETWRDIFSNAEEYVYGLLVEEPIGLIEPIINKAKKGVEVNSIFSNTAIVPRDRNKIISKLGVEKLIKDGTIQRKIKNDIKVAVVLNEKEGGIMFSTIKGEPDISKMFYGDSELIHEWCLDYFRYSWHNAQPFREEKLTKNHSK